MRARVASALLLMAVEPLAMLFDPLRYAGVLRRYLPGMPAFWPWADRATQDFQVEVIREWYLLHRPALRFDAATRTFTTSAS